jgi:hypothetical protein
MTKLLTLSLLATLACPLFAQETRDYGDLIPEDHFQIQQKKTALKDNADITNYEIKVTPQREDYIYKVNGTRSPRKTPFKSPKDFKLRVDRDHGKISQISSVTFSSNDERAGVLSLHSSSVMSNGYINSSTSCYQTYRLGLLSLKTDKSNVNCVTVNKTACEYLEKNKIDEALVQSLNSCSDTLKKLSGHQEDLFKIVKDDARNDLSSLRQLDGRIKKLRNVYEVKEQNLEGLADIVSGYGMAISQCSFLKEKKYFRPTIDLSPTQPTLESAVSNQ